jgi:hypothetical protein
MMGITLFFANYGYELAKDHQMVISELISQEALL